MRRKLEQAANKTKSWKDKVAQHEGLIRLIQPGKRGAKGLWVSDLTLNLNQLWNHSSDYFKLYYYPTIRLDTKLLFVIILLTCISTLCNDNQFYQMI